MQPEFHLGRKDVIEDLVSLLDLLGVFANTCAAAWERMLFATAGLCLGVWLRLTHTDVLAGLLVVAGASFLAIAFIRQSFAPTVFSFAMITSYYWGRKAMLRPI